MLSRACRRMAHTLPIIPSPRLFRSENIAMHGLCAVGGEQERAVEHAVIGIDET
jgi:hypothetical protein